MGDDDPKRLWAPWRMTYLREGIREDGCILCKRVEQPADRDRENLVLFRGERCFVILNRYPYTSGHLMVAPIAHVADIEALDDDTSREMFDLIKRSVAVLKKAYSPDGFNVGVNLGECAGAGIKDHLHFHVVPRWGGDTNFMPVLDDVRVVSQALEETYDELKKVF